MSERTETREAMLRLIEELEVALDAVFALRVPLLIKGARCCKSAIPLKQPAAAPSATGALWLEWIELQQS